MKQYFADGGKVNSNLVRTQYVQCIDRHIFHPRYVVSIRSLEILGGRKEESEKTKRKEEGHSDCRFRGLSYHSIGTDAEGLDFRVRAGTG